MPRNIRYFPVTSKLHIIQKSPDDSFETITSWLKSWKTARHREWKLKPNKNNNEHKKKKQTISKDL